MRLRESDFRRILAFLREADDVDGSEPFPVQLLESLTRLIPADVSHFCELDFQPGESSPTPTATAGPMSSTATRT